MQRTPYSCIHSKWRAKRACLLRGFPLFNSCFDPWLMSKQGEDLQTFSPFSWHIEQAGPKTEN